MIKNPFDGIGLKQIRVFCEILSNAQIRTIEFVRTRFSNDAVKFDTALDFFLKLQLLSTDGVSVTLQTDFEEFLVLLMSTTAKEPLIKEFIFRRLMSVESSFSVEAIDFFAEFHFESELWSFSPSNVQRLRFSGIRNLLIEFDILEVDNATGQYAIIDTRFVTGIQEIPKRKLTRRDFLRISAERDQLGRKAELEIILYEKDRLRLSPVQLTEIEHIAEKDIGAGFDIRSFEEQLDDLGKPIPRYIEVKAVSALDYRFHWSKNEMEMAKKYSSRYFLYLVPVKSSEEFYIDLMKPIRDPINHLFKSQEWECREDSFCFCLVKASRSPFQDKTLVA